MSSNTPPVAFRCMTAEELSRDAAWWAIYHDAFPIHERESRQAILDLIGTGTGIVTRASYGQTTCGIATAHLLCEPPAVFLVYLATAPDIRNKGIGTSLLEYTWKIGAEQLTERGLSPIGLVWEIEIPALANSREESLSRQKRIEFFQRRGGHLLPRSYAQPPLHGTEPVRLHLMFRGVSNDSLPDAGTIESLVRSIYFEKYTTINQISVEILNDLLLAPDGISPSPVRHRPTDGHKH